MSFYAFLFPVSLFYSLGRLNQVDGDGGFSGGFPFESGAW